MFAAIMTLEHIAKDGYREGAVFLAYFFAEVAEIEFHIIVAVVAHFVESAQHIVPVNNARKRNFVLIGKRVVVVKVQYADVFAANGADYVAGLGVAGEARGLVGVSGIYA